MDDGGLEAALARAERAIERVERAAMRGRADRDAAVREAAEREQALRARVREAIGELDALINSAAG